MPTQEVKKKHAGGRPSKFNTIPLKEIEKLSGYGFTDEQIADVFDICVATLKNYKQNPKFLAALKKGKEKADNYVVGSLFHRAIGYSHPEVQLFCYKGKIVQKEIMKHYPPDPTAMIFWLKNRQPANWRDRTEIEHSGEIKVMNSITVEGNKLEPRVGVGNRLPSMN
ncbi:MAG: hypothetical protein H8D45_21505 [Bacteroidetes bacterium]|nr:hypothetical protein [Bacteroidota bacterium]